jgi:hypothetical protein
MLYVHFPVVAAPQVYIYNTVAVIILETVHIPVNSGAFVYVEGIVIPFKTGDRRSKGCISL